MSGGVTGFRRRSRFAALAVGGAFAPVFAFGSRYEIHVGTANAFISPEVFLMRYLFLCVCMMGVLPLVGCDDAHDCGVPLSDYCEGSDCPTWDQALADAELGWDAQTGTCEDLRYVLTRHGFGDFRVLYFDESGTLVAAETTSDAGRVPCDFITLYGPVPECSAEQWWRPW